MRTKVYRNIVAVSDLHVNSRLGLCPLGGARLDDGGWYAASEAQKAMWRCWEYFWTKWVPRVTRGEPYAIVVNGDALEGDHHEIKTIISRNMADQEVMAERVLEAVVKGKPYYHVRGTEAHSGESAEYEEILARKLGAIPDEEERHARYELWLPVGREKHVWWVHFLHHIGVSQSAHTEGTAPLRELVDALTIAARWNRTPPDVIVRSHRHQSYEARIPTARGYAIAVTTPGWQLKTPYCYRAAYARQTPAQIGGTVIRAGDEDCYTRTKTWTIEHGQDTRSAKA